MEDIDEKLREILNLKKNYSYSSAQYSCQSSPNNLY